MSLPEIAAQLRAVLNEATAARARAAEAIAAATLSRDRLAALAPGSAHPSVARAAEKLTAAIARMREADRLAAEAASAVLAYARSIGVTLPTPPAALPTPPPMPPAASAQVPAEPPRPAVPAIPQRVRELARMLPRRGQRDPTDGLVYDASGRWQRESFTSGRDNSASAGLVYPLRAAWSVTDHVEGHVAARMRAEQIRDATLVINQAPCDDEPWGCDRILTAILPPGCTLTVYVADDHGVRWHDTYHGTGKGITS